MSEISIKALLSTACGISIAFAWNNAVAKTIDYHFPPEGEVIQYFLYAILITVFILSAIVIYNKFYLKSGKGIFGDNTDGGIVKIA